MFSSRNNQHIIQKKYQLSLHISHLIHYKYLLQYIIKQQNYEQEQDYECLYFRQYIQQPTRQIIQMNSFRDKLNNKLNIASTKPTPTKLTSFDQTWIKVTVVGGQTQLCPIKLNCQWNTNSNTIIQNKQPQLICKWFNKTQNSMNIIDGIAGSYYQPTLADVGTVVHVQCVPQLEGVQYEGMPIIKEIGPIKIDPETQQQANDLLTAKKATFSIKIKSSDFVDALYGEALLKIQKQSFRIINKTQEQQREIVNLQICDQFPIIKCINGKSKQVQIICEGGAKLTVQMTSNKVRDVLMLLLKLILANRQQYEDKNKQKTNEAIEEVAVLPIILSQSNQEKNQKSEQLQIKNESVTQTNSQTVKSEVFQEPVKPDEVKQIKNRESEKLEKQEKQGSLKHNSNPKSQMSEQQLKEIKVQNSQNKSGHKNVSQIKSSEDLSFTSPVIKKGGSKIEQISTPATSKQNALQMLQITDLKKQLRANEGEIFQLKKTIGEKNETIQGLKQQINRMKEREASLSCNYFQLEDQIKKIKDVSEKSSQQVSYYKNENRILKTDNENMQKKNKMLTQQIIELEQKLLPFTNTNADDEKQETIESYVQIKQNYEKLLLIRDELEVKYSYMKQEAEKVEEKYNQLKESIDQIENQKNFYKKKYENITQQLQSHASSSPVSSSKLLKQKQYSSRILSFESSPSDQPKQQKQVQFDKYEKQILDLKKKLKGLVEQNNFLREVNLASTKDKKSSSKTILKMELVEMKKIVNRLTEDVTEKDLALENMKKINREISDKLLQATRNLDNYQKKSMEQQHTLKHAQTMN